MELILVADVGGTNTRFALAERREHSPKDRPRVFEFWKTPGDDHADFQSAIQAYLHRTGARPSRAVFAVAGPVINNSVTFTNRDWHVDGGALQDKLGLHEVILINDFVAMARSAPLLSENEIEPIRSGQPQPGAPMVVAGPGTGFGLATLLPLRNDYIVVGGEGGHQAFAPQNDYETALQQKLKRQFGYVANEMVAAGVGFDSVLAATFEIYDQTPEPWGPAEVQARALAGDQMCTDLCQMRANVSMTALGDGVLAAAAVGGAWLAGGVSQHLKPYLKSDEAISRFVKRGLMSRLMQDIPINMITSDEAALIGAAGYRRLD